MNDASDRLAELHDLAGAHCEEMLTAEQAARLQELVIGDEELRRRYILYTHIHALAELGRCLPASELGRGSTATAGLPFEHPLCSDVSSSSSPVPGFLSNVAYGTVGYFSSGWPLAYLVATVISGIALVIGSLTPVSQPVQVARQPSVPSRLTVEPKMELIGRITGMVDCKWTENPKSEIRNPKQIANRKSEIRNQKSVVSLGDKFALASGLMEITYDTGARVILQGPVSYEVESAAGGFLSLGKLTARVEKKVASGQWPVASKPETSNPQSLIPNPSLSTNHYPLFTIKTPTATVTDLGTEFGVEVNGQDARVCVFDGVVRVVDRNRQGSETIRAGDAVRIASGAVQRVDAGEAARHFVRQLRPRPVTALLIDDFTAPLLNLKWTWDNPHDKNTYSLTERPGWLRISLATGNEELWMGRRGDGPMLRTETSHYPASFSVEALVDLGAANGGNIPVGFLAGLVLYDTDHYNHDDPTNVYYPFDFTYGFHQQGNNKGFIEVQACGVSDPLLSAAALSNAIRLRMDRDAAKHTWTMYYRKNAADPWILLGIVNDSRLPGGSTTEMELGFFAKTYQHHCSGAKVDFGYYHVTPLPAATHAGKEGNAMNDP